MWLYFESATCEIQKCVSLSAHATIKDITKWAIDNYLELEDHTDVNHLMYNEDHDENVTHINDEWGRDFIMSVELV